VQTVSPRDLVDLVFYRTGVCVYKDINHASSPN
jgi:hypothetical protein